MANSSYSTKKENTKPTFMALKILTIIHKTYKMPKSISSLFKRKSTYLNAHNLGSKLFMRSY